ncbi:MAG: hypothetical protein HQK83_13565 [Fibrobacteria bacterium]|nr:hypothetical protein [Fibrobacteria bacterium]
MNLNNEHQNRPGMLLFLFLCFNLVYGKTIRILAPCYNEEIAVYYSEPREKKDVAVIFMPSVGYMDYRGKINSGKETSVPAQGVFEIWKNKLNEAGYATIQFDKRGVGASSGRLLKEEELSLLCAFSAWDSLENSFSSKYILFTYGAGAENSRYVISKLMSKSLGASLVGVITFAGFTNWSYIEAKKPFSVLMVLGDTALMSESVNRIQAGFKMETSLSEVITFPNTTQELCYRPVMAKHHRCEYEETLFSSVLQWIEKTAETYVIEKEEMNIDLGDW